MFAKKLRDCQTKRKSFICVGLDSDITKIPSKFKIEGTRGVEEFNKYIISETNEYACAYKINIAFYEMLGYKGIEVLENTVDYLKTYTDIPIIIDAKRSDISNTAKAYAKFYFDYLKVDSITINPLMGVDSIEPYLEFPSSHIFALVLTSNPGANDFIIPNKLYLKILEKLQELENTYKDQIGIVVGATQKEYFDEIVEKSEGMIYLIPGIGSQGGKIEDLKILVEKGKTMVINVSRGIIFSEDPKREIIKLREDLRGLTS